MANQIREYFNFSKKERIGILSMLALIVVCWVLPGFFRQNKFDIEELNAFQNEIDVFYASTQAPVDQIEENTVEYKKNLFYFDPNTLNRERWLELGLSEKTVKTIDNFKAHGGKFHKPEDFKKIFGLKKEEYDRLYPFIRIENKAVKISQNEVGKGKIAIASQSLLININAADSITFRRLNGIGPVLSKRIVAYRQKLGGFYRIEQLQEVYGLSDSTYQKIRSSLECDAKDVETININTTSVDALKEHPYIKYRLAAAVIAYRDQHGSFSALSELKKVHLLTDEIFEKIVPYLVTE